jgi:hypothetical protein
MVMDVFLQGPGSSEADEGKDGHDDDDESNEIDNGIHLRGPHCVTQSPVNFGRPKSFPVAT